MGKYFITQQKYLNFFKVPISWMYGNLCNSHNTPRLKGIGLRKVWVRIERPIGFFNVQEAREGLIMALYKLSDKPDFS